MTGLFRGQTHVTNKLSKRKGTGPPPDSVTPRDTIPPNDITRTTKLSDFK